MVLPSAGNAGSVVLGCSYANTVSKTTESASFKMAMLFPVEINGELGFIFSKPEMNKAAEDFKYALVMKFLRVRPSIDFIHLHVVNKWGLMEIPTISFMDDHHVLI